MVLWPFRLLFIGPELDDELAFVHHFHHHPLNVRLHQVSVFFIFAALQVALLPLPGHPNLIFAVAYLLFYFSLHVPTALVWLLAFTLQYALALVVHHLFSSSDLAMLWFGSGLVAAVGFTAQIIGHRVFEGKFPAFRLFEAFVTTPFFLALSVLFELGLYPEWRARLERKSPAYAKYTRRVF